MYIGIPVSQNVCFGENCCHIFKQRRHLNSFEGLTKLCIIYRKQKFPWDLAATAITIYMFSFFPKKWIIWGNPASGCSIKILQRQNYANWMCVLCRYNRMKPILYHVKLGCVQFGVFKVLLSTRWRGRLFVNININTLLIGRFDDSRRLIIILSAYEHLKTGRASIWSRINSGFHHLEEDQL